MGGPRRLRVGGPGRAQRSRRARVSLRVLTQRVVLEGESEKPKSGAVMGEIMGYMREAPCARTPARHEEARAAAFRRLMKGQKKKTAADATTSCPPPTRLFVERLDFQTSPADRRRTDGELLTRGCFSWWR